MGNDIWNLHVSQAGVLYLALEDDYRRLQGRMYRMFGIESTQSLHFATCAKQLGNGLDEQLQRFLWLHQDTKLIIIDTLQKIREAQGEKCCYANDYEVIGKLKQFADLHDICVLIVHHTRKQQADDKFDRISGTNGLLGAADGGLLLEKEKRTSNKATLDVLGRDQQDLRFYLVRDEEHLLWNIEKTEEEPWKDPPDPMLEKINEFLLNEKGVWTGSAAELNLALDLNMPLNILTKKLNIQVGKLRNEFQIEYENTHSRNGSRIVLRKVITEV